MRSSGILSGVDIGIQPVASAQMDPASESSMAVLAGGHPIWTSLDLFGGCHSSYNHHYMPVMNMAIHGYTHQFHIISSQVYPINHNFQPLKSLPWCPVGFWIQPIQICLCQCQGFLSCSGFHHQITRTFGFVYHKIDHFH